MPLDLSTKYPGRPNQWQVFPTEVTIEAACLARSPGLLHVQTNTQYTRSVNLKHPISTQKLAHTPDEAAMTQRQALTVPSRPHVSRVRSPPPSMASMSVMPSWCISADSHTQGAVSPACACDWSTALQCEHSMAVSSKIRLLEISENGAVILILVRS